MSLTLPNLDDRTFADLMEEARSLLVAHAPALTNHNPSDPLITLSELFAYFTEILLYRLNLVTDDSRKAFLRLLVGPDAAPPTDLDAAIRNAVLTLRRVDRAVTPADFEFLALTAPLPVARAKCIPERNLDTDDPVERHRARTDHVSLVIVPQPGADLEKLKTDLTAYLEPRRLLGTRMHVVGARSVPITVQVTLHLLPDAFESTLDRAVAALTAYFDPVSGRGGGGWPFGRAVHVSEIYQLLDSVPGVDFVTRTPSGLPAPQPQELDELTASAEFAERIERNELNELISIVLEPEELVTIAADIRVRSQQ